jgi:hypothetical protein
MQADAGLFSSVGKVFHKARDLVGDVFDKMTDLADGVFVATKTIGGQSVKVMLDFEQAASQLPLAKASRNLAVRPLNIASDGIGQLREMHMRIAREVIRQRLEFLNDTGFLEVAMMYGFEASDLLDKLSPLPIGDIRDEALEELFRTVLSSDDITKEMLKCALGQDFNGLNVCSIHNRLVDLMDSIARGDKGVRHRLAALMAKDEEVADLVLDLSLQEDTIGHMFLETIDDTSFAALTQAMVRSRQPDASYPGVGNKGVELIFTHTDDDHEEITLCCMPPEPPSAMMSTMMKLGDKNSNNDANEAALERMLMATFSDPDSGHHFMDALQSPHLEPGIADMFLGFTFLGMVDQNPSNAHINQSFLNAYSMSQGFVTGIFPCLDQNQPPDPNNLCNGLMNRMMPILIDFDPQTGMPLNWSMNGHRMVLACKAKRDGGYEDPYSNLPEAYCTQFLGLMAAFGFDVDDSASPFYIDTAAGLAALGLTEAVPPRPFYQDGVIGDGTAVPVSATGVTTSYNVQQITFGYDFLNQPLYIAGTGGDKWLNLPTWLAPADWFVPDNSETMRKKSQSEIIGSINADPDHDRIVFLVLPQDIPHSVWTADNAGVGCDKFVPIYGETIETVEQTNLRLFAKKIPAGESAGFCGNGGGKYHYTVAMMVEGVHASYAQAAQLLADATAINQIDWLTTNIVTPNSSAHGMPAGYSELGYFDVNSYAEDTQGQLTHASLTLGMKSDVQALHGDIVKLVKGPLRRTELGYNSTDKVNVAPLPGYSVIGFFYPDGSGTGDTFDIENGGSQNRYYTSVQVKHGYEDYVKLSTLGDGINTFDTLPEYRMVGWWKVSECCSTNPNIDSFGNVTKNGRMSLHIRELDDMAGIPRDNAYDDGLRYSTYYSNSHPSDAAAYQTKLTNAVQTSLHYGTHLLARLDNTASIKPMQNPFGDSNYHLSRLTGVMEITEAGTYSFALDGDDAVELRIDGVVRTGWYGGHGEAGSPTSTPAQVTLDLTVGLHSVEVLHEDGSGDARLSLYWIPPSESVYTVVPADQFAHARYDKDGDGIADGDDLCPTSAAGKPINMQGCAETILEGFYQPESQWQSQPAWSTDVVWYSTYNEEGLSIVSQPEQFSGGIVLLLWPDSAPYPSWAITDGFYEVNGNDFVNMQQEGYTLFAKHVDVSFLVVIPITEAGNDYRIALLRPETDEYWSVYSQIPVPSAPLSRVTIVADKSTRGSSVPISESLMIEYCGDVDGCNVRLAMADYNTAGDIASRTFTVYYNAAMKRWRVSTDATGNNNNGSAQSLYTAWACYFTDGSYNNWSNLGDPDSNFGLLSWDQNDAECSVTIIDHYGP